MKTSCASITLTRGGAGYLNVPAALAEAGIANASLSRGPANCGLRIAEWFSFKSAIRNRQIRNRQIRNPQLSNPDYWFCRYE